MADEKIKISELEELTTLDGFFTIGSKTVDGVPVSYKVNLGRVQTAINSATTAATSATNAASAANTAASNANAKATLANTAASTANTAATNADAKATLANTAAGAANTAATAANTAASFANEKAALAGEKAGDADTAATRANEAAEAAEEAVETMEGTYAKKDGYYSGLGAGTADNLVGRGSVPATFTLRPTAGSASVGSGAATIKALKGNTIVWNQLAAPNSYGIERTSNGITISPETDGSIRIYGTSTSSNFFHLVPYPYVTRIVLGHKYYIGGLVSISNNVGVYRFFSQSGFFFDSYICTAETIYMFMRVYDGQSIDVTIKPFIIDLTLIFGAGNEPSTVEEFEALFPLDYYAYNAGELLSFNGTGIKTDGFNQWDEEWELGSIDPNGQKISSSGICRSKNYIEVFPNTDYYLAYFGDMTAGYPDVIYYYDSERNFISRKASGVYNSLFTTPVNCKYLLIRIQSPSYTKGNICINISHSGIRNGEYEPYWTETKQLPALDFFNVTYTGADGQQHVAGGMKSAGTARDEWNGTKKVRRIGVVDLGAQSVVYIAGNRYFQVTITDLKNKPYTSVDLFCPIYTAARWSVSSDVDMVMRFSNSNDNRVWIRNSAYTDAASFKTAMAGVLLFYELAEPVEADAEPLGNYREDDYGTETLLPENGDEPTTSPIIMDVQYPMNAVDTLRNLPKNYQSQESMDAALTALGTALGFTYTKTWDATNGKWTYAITRTTE